LVGFIIGASVPVALSGSFAQALIARLLGYTLFLLGTILALHRYRESGLRAEIDLITFQYADHLNDIRFAKEKQIDALQRFESLRKGRLLEEQYKLAVAKCKYLTNLFHDKRLRLLHTNWRSLRGIAFENFLADVFRVLGFHVEMTKASGDQGVDLIVTKGKGRKIAVQAKGYDKSVGNKAVQEAFAGMRFYRCTDCAVITNSEFTPGACDLADKMPECTLIDGACLPDLIKGDIF
jgi:restriction endonuclease Mrr